MSSGWTTARERADHLIMVIAPVGANDDWLVRSRAAAEKTINIDRASLVSASLVTILQAEDGLAVVSTTLRTLKAQVDELIGLCNVADAALREAQSE